MSAIDDAVLNAAAFGRIKLCESHLRAAVVKRDTSAGNSALARDARNVLFAAARKQLASEQVFHDGAVNALTEDMIAAVDYVNSAAVSQALDGGAALEPEQSEAGFSSGKQKNHENSVCRDLLQLDAKIVRQSNPHTPRNISARRFDR